jgi:hypothetical protein
MFSIEHIVHMNDLKALKGARLKLVGINLVNAKTNEIATQRTFVTIDSARRYCDEFHAEFAGVSRK